MCIRDRALAQPALEYATRLSLAVTAARVHESTSRADAVKQLQSTITEATNRGYLKVALEARLSLAEMEVRSGQLAMGRAHLASVDKEAAARGFGLLARKARASLAATLRI